MVLVILKKHIIIETSGRKAIKRAFHIIYNNFTTTLSIRNLKYPCSCGEHKATKKAFKIENNA